MRTSPAFLRIRAISFSSFVLISFFWIVSLCVVLFSQWEIIGHSEKSLLSIMLVTHCITAITLLILLILPFRPWLDSARVFFLLLAQLGIAFAFAYWYPRFQCLTQSPARESLCTLIIAYILIVSWVVPVLLVIYVTGLGFMVWKRSASGDASIPGEEDIRTKQPSMLSVAYP